MLDTSAKRTLQSVQQIPNPAALPSSPLSIAGGDGVTDWINQEAPPRRRVPVWRFAVRRRRIAYFCATLPYVSNDQGLARSHTRTQAHKHKLGLDNLCFCFS
jgi:hypothetical protein